MLKKEKKIIGVIVILGKVYMFFRLEKPVFLLFDVCNDDSYCDKWYRVGVRTRS